jgi:hypothetical protein
MNSKCLTENFNTDFRKDFDFVLLSITRVMNRFMMQYGFDRGNDEMYRKDEIILDM